MHALTRTGRCVAVAVILLAIPLWTGTASARPSHRRVITTATAAAIKRTKAEATTAERSARHLRAAARRACAARRKKACSASRRHLARTQARLARLDKTLDSLTRNKRSAKGSAGAGSGNSSNGGGSSLGSSGTGVGESSPIPRLPDTPLASGMLVGLDAGGWGPGQYADVKGAVSYVRLDSENPQTASISDWTNAGVKVIDDMSGPYTTGGVKALNQTEWVNRAVAWVRANPAVVAVEVLNEPGGSWFWGSEAESVANATAYGELCKKVHEAFVADFGSARPLILASYDGGHDDEVTWGERVWAATPHMNEYVDGITMHPYSELEANPLGSRANVERAHAKTGLPVYITEIGWETSVVSEDEQASDIYNFIAWARGTGYVAAVTIFNYRDFSNTEGFWGIETWEGRKKPSYTALHEAAAELPLSL